jgi:hypothetical protein
MKWNLRLLFGPVAAAALVLGIARALATFSWIMSGIVWVTIFLNLTTLHRYGVIWELRLPGIRHSAASKSNSLHSAARNSPGRTNTYGAIRSAACVAAYPHSPR